jgi:hypothetical protein
MPPGGEEREKILYAVQLLCAAVDEPPPQKSRKDIV